jgi:two-component system response regulator YesN
MSFVSWQNLKQWELEFNQARVCWLHNSLPLTTEAYLDLLSKTSFTVPLNQEGAFSIELWLQKWKEAFSHVYSYLHISSDQHIIHEIERYLNKYSHQTITLQRIADRFSLSREYISRKFKAEFKENVSEYLTRIRLEKAQKLLIHTKLSSNQIAKITGYKDEKYLGVVFKDKIGRSPQTFRKDNNTAK